MTGQLGLALQAFLQEAHPDDNRDRHLVPARPQPQARLGRSHGPACVSHFQGVGSSPATPSHPHRRPPAPGTRWWFFQCLRWPRSEGFTSAISKAGHGSDSPGIPGLLSLLERPGGGGLGNAVPATGRAAGAASTTRGRGLRVSARRGLPPGQPPETALPRAPPGAGLRQYLDRTSRSSSADSSRSRVLLPQAAPDPPPGRSFSFSPTEDAAMLLPGRGGCCATAPAQTWARRQKGPRGEERPGQSAPWGPGGALRHSASFWARAAFSVSTLTTVRRRAVSFR